ncbi:hypothetical protein SBC1_73180 (plasmid) [Caballeronia sp. SBC1]|jgi:hypothetical protein|nr:hypothetical protein SBC2_73080 [Caballeronia sp. SBC2]QIN67271.1 hypothetical protein SBC1_73180 [Caballeronia sp. SBC1]
MQNLVQIACSACLVVATAATAQTLPPQPSAGGTPDKMPFDIPYVWTPRRGCSRLRKPKRRNTTGK